MKTVTIRDETASGDILNEIALRFAEEYITVEELISARIAQEIKKHEKNQLDFSKILVRPTDFERRLNKKKPQKIDVEKQTYVALKAFQENGFFILIDNEQAEELQQKFHIDETTHVSFIKLTPLVGG